MFPGSSRGKNEKANELDMQENEEIMKLMWAAAFIPA